MSETKAGDVRPWGRAATLGLGVGALLAGQAAALMVLTWHFGVGLAQLPDFSGDGVSVTLIMLVATPVQLALLMLMARQTGAGAADYLGLIRPRRADVVMGIVAVVAFILVGNAVSWLLGQNIVTGFQRDIYRSAGAAGMLPLLWLVVVVVTPVNEETAVSRLPVPRLASHAARRLDRDHRHRGCSGPSSTCNTTYTSSGRCSSAA